MSYAIRVEKSQTLKSKPNPEQLGFGKYFTDHMFIMDYTEGQGWHDARIVPYAPLSLDPSAMVFHYGQAVFEGLKVFKTVDGDMLMFRPEKNAERLNRTNDRMSIPQIDEKLFIEAIQQLVRIDADWIPDREGYSLYVRPFIIATEPMLGVRPAHNYLFMVILSPVGSYYPDGIKPIRIFVEQQYVRAVRGGVGNAKTAGNYAASLKAQLDAKKKQCEQVLWLDGIEQKYIEEVGSMNVFFKINDEVVTPILNGSILDGVTRRSMIELMRNWGITVTERRITMQEIFEAGQDGSLKEVFGTGTAAVISPVGSLYWNDQALEINNAQIGPLSQRLYDTVIGLQYGKMEDSFGWTRRFDVKASVEN